MHAAPSGPPIVQTFVAGVNVNISWEHAPVGNGILLSYNLTCSVDGEEVLRAQLKPVQGFTLEELSPSTTYSCSMYGSTSGGDGPSATFTFTTDGLLM